MILRDLKFGVILSLSGRAVYCFWLSDSLGCNFYKCDLGINHGFGV